MTQQEARNYDKLVAACGIYNELRLKYQRLTRLSVPQFAVAQFAQSPSDVQRLRYCVGVFEELIGPKWYERN